LISPAVEISETKLFPYLFRNYGDSRHKAPISPSIDGSALGFRPGFRGNNARAVDCSRAVSQSAFPAGRPVLSPRRHVRVACWSSSPPRKALKSPKRSASDGTVTSESLLTAVATLGYMIGDVGQDETREPGHDNSLLKWSEPGKASFAPIR
jgi:hypothetical protein